MSDTPPPTHRLTELMLRLVNAATRTDKFWSHINCKTINMHFGVAKILDSVGNPVLDCHKLHMREQRGEVKDK